MTLLTIENLTIHFGDTAVVREVLLSVEKGQIVAIVGESGSGKTLTAQSILKLLPGNAEVSGKITFNGTDITHWTDAQMATLRGDRIGMIFQEPMSALNPLHTIARQVIEPYCIHRRVRRTSAQAQQKLAELFDAVGLSHLKSRGKLYPHQLSGGERQRAMIAMAIANDPDLLIADEPTTALDITLQHQILDLLKKLQTERGMGMLFITHDLPMVKSFADRVYVMREGRVMEAGTIAEIFTDSYHPYTKELIASAPHGIPQPVGAHAEEILSTEHLCVNFPVKGGLLRHTIATVPAVKNVTLRLRAGETVGIVGESGSGKTSLGLAILRLIDSHGPILFLGHALDAMTREQIRPHRADMQLVFQDPFGSLNPRMTVGELVAEGLLVHTPEATAATRDDAVDTILAQVGLTPEMKHRYPHEFSGGQRQRIAIARAMILRPKLVVLDEPTSALDMTVQKQVLDLLRDFQQTHGVSYLFISHDLRVIRAIAHQVIVMKSGDVVEHAPAEQLFTNPQHEYTQALLGAAFGD